MFLLCPNLSPHALAEPVWWALSCSHGGDVVCVDGGTGRVAWRACLPGRCEAGLTVTSDLR